MQKTNVFETVSSLQETLNVARNEGKTIGFVPTMGALHLGHISLVKKALEVCDVVVVSIFVNPTQFNNSKDLEKYPRTLDHDLELLSEAGVPFTFVPSVKEIYPEDSIFEPIAIGSLGEVMEGEFRPGHFDGVIQVVKRLFDIVNPDFAYFGKKDFQQLAVIKFMTNYFKLTVKIIGCEIIRETNGLAMSSRNTRLDASAVQDALLIIETLNFAKENVNLYTPLELIDECITFFGGGNLKLEYLEIVHPDTLVSLKDEWVPGATCCIACFCEEVRLIDNMELISRS